jgi:hypothetical protein
MRIGVVAVPPSEERGGAVVIAIHDPPDEREGDPAERRLALQGDGGARIPLERTGFPEGHQGRTEDDGERGHHRGRSRRASSEGQRRNPRAGSDGGDVESGAQIELVSLEHAEDGQHPVSPSTRVAQTHPQRNHAEREHEPHRAGGDRVDGAWPVRRRGREPASDRRQQGKPGSDERKQPRHGGHRENGPRPRRRAFRQHATRHLGGHHQPRGGDAESKEHHGRGAGPSEDRLRAQCLRNFQGSHRRGGREKERRDSDTGTEQKRDRREHTQVGERDGHEPRAVNVTRLGGPRLDQGDGHRADRCARQREEDACDRPCHSGTRSITSCHGPGPWDARRRRRA